MHLSHLLLSLFSLSLTTTATPTPTSSLTPRKFNPLPNPYPIPGSRILLDFDPHPDALLPHLAVQNLLAKTTTQIAHHIQTSGDGPIPLGVQGFRLEGVQITYDCIPQYRVMLYSDVLTVVRGIRSKMWQEGWRERTAIVLFEREGGQGEIETGEVDVGWVGGRRRRVRRVVE